MKEAFDLIMNCIETNAKSIIRLSEAINKLAERVTILEQLQAKDKVNDLTKIGMN